MADSAYFVGPSDSPGPGLLLLHSWWGLNPFFRRLADRFADEGFTVLAPDLNFGRVFDDAAGAETHLHEASPDRLAMLTLSSARLLQQKSVDPTGQIGVVGFSMGASLGLWASVRLPEVIGAVSAFYGTQSIDFSGSRSGYQIHLAGDDEVVEPDDAAFMEATMGLQGLDVEVHSYPGVGHWFFESDRPGFHEESADLAWRRTVSFLHSHIG